MIRINGGQATLGANTFTGAQVAPSLALGGASLGSHALAVTGTTHFTGNVDSTGYTNTSTAFQAAAGGSFYWNARSLMASPSDGVIKLLNNAQTDFSRLQFGGTTSSFPAIKRNATALNFRLADDSADAPITAGAATFSGLTTMAAFAATGTSSVIGSTTIAGAASGNATATFRVFGGLSNSAGFQVAHNSATDASLILNTVAGGTLGIGANNAAVLTFAATTNAVAISTSLTLGGVLTVPGVTTAALTSTGTFTSGAGAQVGTLTNAPAAGNPTTWIKIIDNGTTRYIPAW